MDNFDNIPRESFQQGAPYIVHPRPQLTVGDVERLAKAGVTMTFKEIKDYLTPVDEPRGLDPGADLVFRRWYMNPENDMRRLHGARHDFHIATARHGDTMHVFIAATDKAPVIIEDDVHLFPSDALLAKIHLLLRMRTP